jgi:hypothetical protein
MRIGNNARQHRIGHRLNWSVLNNLVEIDLYETRA